jgi:hypothetical protein
MNEAYRKTFLLSFLLTCSNFQVRLFIEEVDKITSLIIGLSSRLVRVSLHPSSRDMEPRDQVPVYAQEGLAPPLKE